MEWNVHFYFSVKQFLPSTFDSNFHLGVFCCTIQDIELSREINDSFRQSAQARLKLPSGIEMNVHVLTTGYVLLGDNYQLSIINLSTFCSFPAHRKFALSRLETPVSLVFHVFPHSYLNI